MSVSGAKEHAMKRNVAKTRKIQKKTVTAWTDRVTSVREVAKATDERNSDLSSNQTMTYLLDK
jgi:hypothetical protein